MSDASAFRSPSRPDASREYFIHGITSGGRVFRPSDWAERLCGVMSCYRPGGIESGRDAYIGYSPYVRPMLVAGVKCVVVDARLRELERMAFDFVMNFARDNDLQVVEACSLPDPPSAADLPSAPSPADLPLPPSAADPQLSRTVAADAGSSPKPLRQLVRPSP